MVHLVGRSAGIGAFLHIFFFMPERKHDILAHVLNDLAHLRTASRALIQGVEQAVNPSEQFIVLCANFR